MTTLKVVDLPNGSVADVPGGLRRLADKIEAGEFGDAHNLAWVIDCGDSRIDIGMLGSAPEAGPLAYFLFGMAKAKFELGVLS